MYVFHFKFFILLTPGQQANLNSQGAPSLDSWKARAEAEGS